MVYDLSAFQPGQRVQLHPATDLWMQGARYGEVTNVGRSRITVRLDINNRKVRLAPSDIEEIL